MHQHCCDDADLEYLIIAQRFVSRPTAWIGRGAAFSTPKAQRRQVGPSWYALRFWIELGFKALKSLGWIIDKGSGRTLARRELALAPQKAVARRPRPWAGAAAGSAPRFT